MTTLSSHIESTRALLTRYETERAEAVAFLTPKTPGIVRRALEALIFAHAEKICTVKATLVQLESDR